MTLTCHSILQIRIATKRHCNVHYAAQYNYKVYLSNERHMQVVNYSSCLMFNHKYYSILTITQFNQQVFLRLMHSKQKTLQYKASHIDEQSCILLQTQRMIPNLLDDVALPRHFSPLTGKQLTNRSNRKTTRKPWK